MNDKTEQLIARLNQIRKELKELQQGGEQEDYRVYSATHEDSHNALLKLSGELDGEGCIAVENFMKEVTEQESLFILFLYSFLLHATRKTEFAERICDYINTERFSRDHRLFVFHQLKRFFLMHPEMKGTPTVQNLYDSVVSEWKRSFQDVLISVKQDERNPKLIVVITLQFLGHGHAPTNTALERIYTVGAGLQKDVICINSREQYTLKGFLPIFLPIGRAIDRDYNGVHTTSHNGFDFALIQPEVEMPDEEMVKMLLEEIRNLAPWMVIVCGDRCLLGDLCAEIIPTICIPMTFSTIPKKEHEYVAVGRELSKSEKNNLIAKGYDLDSVIESVFTFELAQQTTTLTRADLGLPKDKFLLGIIGIRLDAEVQPEFLNVLLSCVDMDIHLVFAGYFEKYDQLCEDIDGLREHSTFIGYQKDILALWDVLDLYVNPPRVGGGFSVAEAFCKSKPGITLNWGDVAASAGSVFCVESLDEYPDLIRRYVTDQGFYNEMGEKALARSKRLFDSKGEMEKILQEAEKRSLWF